MAILTSQPHIEVTVIIGDKAAEEYADNGSEPIRDACNHKEHRKLSSTHTVVKYIKSISDAVFKIEVRVNKKYDFASDQLSIWTWIGGGEVEGINLTKPQTKYMRGWPKRSQTGQWSVLPHKFCSIFAENKEVLHLADHDEEARKHGDIEVLVYRTKLYGEVHASTYYGKGAPQIIGVLSEEAMNGKILTHSVSSEDPVPISQPCARSVDFMNGRDHPIARFIFRYRSREALQKLQIMETPIDHVDKMSVEELRQRYRHSLSMNRSPLATLNDDQVRKIKYESDDSSDEAQTRRKRKR